MNSSSEPVVRVISATSGGSSTFMIAPLNSPDRERIVSSSTLIQNILLTALLSGAEPVKVEFVLPSNEIARVYPFALGHSPKVIFYGDYNVSRIATQRKPNGTDEHLEVFLKKVGASEEKAYNVYDPFLQQLLIAAFSSKGPVPLRVDAQFDGNKIFTVTLGEKYDGSSK